MSVERNGINISELHIRWRRNELLIIYVAASVYERMIVEMAVVDTYNEQGTGTANRYRLCHSI